MSVLSFPRIYFTGYMCWDPATGNNNDYFPTYADAEASLNWDFLKGQGIDQSNYRTTFRPWVISQQTIDGTTGIPGEWNYFGGNACYFVQYQDASKQIDRRTLITGGSLDGKPLGSDPLFNTPVTLFGDPFGDPEPKPPGRLIDIDPASVYSAQIFYNSMTFGNANAGIAAPRAHRMQSRFVNFTRNFNLGAAGGASVTWQACFPAGPTLKINVGQSQLLAKLQSAISSGEAKGLMVRFNTYLNLYFQNGFFNNFQPQPKSAADLPALYKAGLDTGNQFSNPCYSRVVGVIGPWYADELATCPEGRYLQPPGNEGYLCDPRAAGPCWTTAPAPAVARVKSADQHQAAVQESSGVQGGPINIPTAAPKSAAQLGVALAEIAEIDKTRGLLSIDLLNTFPEWFWEGDKADFSDILVGVLNSAGAFTQVGSFPFASYSQAGYERGGGIVDLAITAAQVQQLRNGKLALQAGTAVRVAKLVGRDTNGRPIYQQDANRTVLIEQPLTAQTDQRGIYLNEDEKLEVQVSVRNMGKPAAGANLLVVRYCPPDGGGSVDAISTTAPNQVVDILNGQAVILTVQPDNSNKAVQTKAAVLQADTNGLVTISIAAASPGFPVLVFYPYLAGQPQPAVPGSFDAVGTAMFTSIRVLSYDDAFVDEFVQLWNSTKDPAKAWDFIYSNILYLYDMIFPVMLRYVPLGDRQRVEAAIDQVLALIAPSYFAESTLAMPITRDLSRGKRTVLELWGSLVKRNYPPQPISKPPAA